MITYQLRFPDGVDLDTVFRDTTVNVWEALNRFQAPWRGSMEGLEELLKKVFDKHALAYDTCDTSLICDETSTPAPWNRDPDPVLLSNQPESRRRVRRCHFRVFHRDIDAFARENAEMILNAAGHPDLKGNHPALDALVEAWRQALGPYLFLSFCRETEPHSGAKEVDPWQAVKSPVG